MRFSCERVRLATVPHTIFGMPRRGFSASTRGMISGRGAEDAPAEESRETAAELSTKSTRGRVKSMEPVEPTRDRPAEDTRDKRSEPADETREKHSEPADETRERRDGGRRGAGSSAEAVREIGPEGVPSSCKGSYGRTGEKAGARSS